MRRVIVLFLTIWVFASAASADETPEQGPDGRPTFEQVRETVRFPLSAALSSMSPNELMVRYQLAGVRYDFGAYDPKPHARHWLELMRDAEAEICDRLCAAYFLADDSDEARRFLERELKSEDPRHRYNAAEAVRARMTDGRAKTWAAELLLRAIAEKSLEENVTVRSTEGDSDYSLMAPMDSICWSFGFIKYEPAVPVLIDVLGRLPATTGAAFALGEIGDRSAIPALMKVLTSGADCQRQEIHALGKLRALEAVPVLVARLGKPSTTFSGMDIPEMRAVLDALAAIGNDRAVEPIKDYLGSGPSHQIAVAAKRALAQLDAEDPVAELIGLFQNETYEPEKGDILRVLANYPADSRVLPFLEDITADSESAFLRRGAIYELGRIDSRESLLILAGMVNQTFPADLKAEWGWKIPPDDFTPYFQGLILDILKEETGADLPADAEAWQNWLRANRADALNDQ